jgi:acyl-CoA hydrolase
LGAIDRFVALNTALEVGFDGSVNIEQVGIRVAGIGGHADFCAARFDVGRRLVNHRLAVTSERTLHNCPDCRANVDREIGSRRSGG